MFKRLRAAVRPLTNRFASVTRLAKAAATCPGYFRAGGVKTFHIGTPVDQPALDEAVVRARELIIRDMGTGVTRKGLNDLEQLSALTTVLIRRDSRFLADMPGEVLTMVKLYPGWPGLVIHISADQRDLPAAIEHAVGGAWRKVLEMPPPRRQTTEPELAA